jgi:hypothetical protein
MRRQAGVVFSAVLAVLVITAATLSSGASAAPCVPGTAVVPIGNVSFASSLSPDLPHASLRFWSVSRYKRVGQDRTYIDFTLPAIGSGCSVTSASLIKAVGAPSIAPKRAINVSPIRSPWNAATLTWHNQPARGPVKSTVAGGSAVWNLTSSITSLYRPGVTSYGLALTAAPIPASKPNGFGFALLVGKGTGAAPLLRVIWA